jgi:hypothetical protein
MFFRQRRYNSDVTNEVNALMKAHLGADVGSELASAVFFFAFEQEKSGTFNVENMMKSYRKSGLSTEEAAVSLIDGGVTFLKAARDLALREGREVPQMIENYINKSELVIDCWMKSPRRIMPRNGKFAQTAARTGLDKYFR